MNSFQNHPKVFLSTCKYRNEEIADSPSGHPLTHSHIPVPCPHHRRQVSKEAVIKLCVLYNVFIAVFKVNPIFQMLISFGIRCHLQYRCKPPVADNIYLKILSFLCFRVNNQFFSCLILSDIFNLSYGIMGQPVSRISSPPY